MENIIKDNYITNDLEFDDNYIRLQRYQTKNKIIYFFIGLVIFIAGIVSLALQGIDFTNITLIIISVIYMGCVGVYISISNKPEYVIDGVVTTITEIMKKTSVPESMRNIKGYEYKTSMIYKYTVQSGDDYFITEPGIKNEKFVEGENVTILKYKWGKPIIIKKTSATGDDGITTSYH